MSFQNYKTKLLLWTKAPLWKKNFVGEITFIKKTGREIQLLVGNCQTCNKRKSMNVSDNTIEVEGSGDFFKNLGKRRLIVSKEMAKNVIKNPGRALESGPNVDSAFAFRSPKQLYHHYQR